MGWESNINTTEIKLNQNNPAQHTQKPQQKEKTQPKTKPTNQQNPK